jgi:hypothetical protein
MPHIEIMKFCQNHWSLLFINQLINQLINLKTRFEKIISSPLATMTKNEQCVKANNIY